MYICLDIASKHVRGFRRKDFKKRLYGQRDIDLIDFNSTNYKSLKSLWNEKI